ncbi:Peptidase S54 [Trypanosoma melophagium]|uniref:Peptidase S54 n=1 Tax=Trypanosoma melophagium TaxID=715481 RepID=UPI00351A4416|nr:Peptidase S54 [Trypanosoma melophagium]
MVHIDVACTAIRLTPVWICFAVHCSKGHWPTQLEALSRIVDYGFSVDSFKQRPEVLLTHLFVHANDEHLMGNMVSLTGTLMEFGGDTMKENVEEDSLNVSIRRTIGSFVVFIGGGIIGGIGGQLLFNDAQRKRRYHRWLSFPGLQQGNVNDILGTICNSNNNNNNNSVSSPLSALASRVRRWADDMMYKLDKRRSDSIFMCGASGGVCALAGFNAVYYNRWATAVTLVMPECIAVMCALCDSSSSRIAGTAWLPAGEVVGHAAHVGGFMAGVCLGAVWRWWRGDKKRRYEEEEGWK